MKLQRDVKCVLSSHRRQHKALYADFVDKEADGSLEF